ncbi:hypothetical protein pipiens_002013 [Culex pipiens pipiens]|uniref:Uncharacterized protein n=1 Tax=Culex pipiens pipiens TaxID=38569 RepID=A0ABD1DNZ6_CULPP
MIIIFALTRAILNLLKLLAEIGIRTSDGHLIITGGCTSGTLTQLAAVHHSRCHRRTVCIEQDSTGLILGVSAQTTKNPILILGLKTSPSHYLHLQLSQ